MKQTNNLSILVLKGVAHLSKFFAEFLVFTDRMLPLCRRFLAFGTQLVVFSDNSRDVLLDQFQAIRSATLAAQLHLVREYADQLLHRIVQFLETACLGITLTLRPRSGTDGGHVASIVIAARHGE